MKMTALFITLAIAGCATKDRAGFTGWSVVGGTQMNLDNYFGNFYERDESFGRNPGSTVASLNRSYNPFQDARQDVVEETFSKSVPAIGIKFKGEF